MGVGTGTGVMKKVARGAAIGVLVVAMGACGSSSKGSSGPATISSALALYYAGETSKATTQFHDIVKADPTNKFGWYNLGVIAQYAGNSKEA